MTESASEGNTANRNKTLAKKGFIILGIFMYFCAAIGLGSLLMRGVGTRKHGGKQ